jgi:hypothetical protein
MPLTIFALTRHHEPGGEQELLAPYPSLDSAIDAMPGPVKKRAGRDLQMLGDGWWVIKVKGHPEYQVQRRLLERDGTGEFDGAVLAMAADVLRQRYGVLVAGGTIEVLRDRSIAIGGSPA